MKTTIIVLAAVAAMLVITPFAVAGKSMPCAPYQPCAPWYDDPSPEPTPPGVPEVWDPANGGPCDDRGGILYIESVQEGPFLIIHYVICANGTVIPLAEEGILSRWNGGNEPQPDPFPDPVPSIGNDGAPYWDPTPIDDPYFG